MNEDFAVDQLIQLFRRTTWDGDLIDKLARDNLRARGLASKTGRGWNFITTAGIKYLESLDCVNLQRCYEVKEWNSVL